MKLTELLVSIAISFLILTSAFYAYSACMKCNKNAVFYSSSTKMIEKYDYELRNQIQGTDIPYWSNMENSAHKASLDIAKNFINNEDIVIEKIESLKDINDKTYGLKVHWKYLGKELITSESFSTKNIFRGEK